MSDELIGKPIEEIFGSKIKTIDCYVSHHPQSGVTILKVSKIFFENGTWAHLSGHWYGAYLPIDGKLMNHETLIELGRANEAEEDVREILESE